MPWVRFDDQFPIHRKVSRLSDAAFRLHVSAIFWCARNLTDGVVPEEDLEDVCARVRTPARFVTELLNRGVWHEAGAECGSEDCPAHKGNAAANDVTRGWVIHDYLEFQPSKERVLRDREANATRQKKWRDQQKRKGQNRNGVSNATSNGGSNSAPSRPDPSRRDGGSVDRSSSGSRRARAREDDPDDQQINTRITELITELTGRTIDDDQADQIRHRILDGRNVTNPLAYVTSAIRGEPHTYLPADSDPADRTVAEALRHPSAGCPHGHPRGRYACPFCRRGLPGPEDE